MTSLAKMRSFVGARVSYMRAARRAVEAMGHASDASTRRSDAECELLNTQIRLLTLSNSWAEFELGILAGLVADDHPSGVSHYRNSPAPTQLPGDLDVEIMRNEVALCVAQAAETHARQQAEQRRRELDAAQQALLAPEARLWGAADKNLS